MNRRIGVVMLWFSVTGGIFACEPPKGTCLPTEELRGDDSTSASSGNEMPVMPSLKDFGPNARRVAVVVLPGDAEVEVDGVVVRRRDGAVELIGNVGDVHRLRVIHGGNHMEQKVTIGDAGSPPLIDLNARIASAGIGSSARSSTGLVDSLDVLLPRDFK